MAFPYVIILEIEYSIVTDYLYYTLLPDCMFIHKMLESDWLDYGTWTIYTFPYRLSGPFIRLSIKDKIFGKMVENLLTEDREKLVTFGKFSVNFPEKN